MMVKMIAWFCLFWYSVAAFNLCNGTRAYQESYNNGYACMWNDWGSSVKPVCDSGSSVDKTFTNKNFAGIRYQHVWSCLCKAGFQGMRIGGSGNAPVYCAPVKCPSGSSGADVPSGCACNAGYSGMVTATTATPYYSGTCTADAEKQAAEHEHEPEEKQPEVHQLMEKPEDGKPATYYYSSYSYYRRRYSSYSYYRRRYSAYSYYRRRYSSYSYYRRRYSSYSYYRRRYSAYSYYRRRYSSYSYYRRRYSSYSYYRRRYYDNKEPAEVEQAEDPEVANRILTTVGICGMLVGTVAAVAFLAKRGRTSTGTEALLEN